MELLKSSPFRFLSSLSLRSNSATNNLIKSETLSRFRSAVNVVALNETSLFTLVSGIAMARLDSPAC